MNDFDKFFFFFFACFKHILLPIYVLFLSRVSFVIVCIRFEMNAFAIEYCVHIVMYVLFFCWMCG